MRILNFLKYYNVDPLADYNPFYNSEHYIDGQHNGGVYNSGNLNPYIYTYQNPIKYVDPNGKQVAVIETRSFAPFSTFGYLVYPNIRDGKTTVGPFKGDGTGAKTTNPHATYRIGGSVNINLAKKNIESYNAAPDAETFETSTGQRHFSKGYLSASKDFDFTFGFGDTQSYSIHNYGTNSLVTFSPDIDVFVDFNAYKISQTKNGNIIYRIYGEVSGDQFPSQILLLRDKSGNSTILSSFDASPKNRNNGPLLLLPGQNRRAMGEFSVDVTYDKSGEMIRAQQVEMGGGHRDLKIDHYGK